MFSTKILVQLLHEFANNKMKHYIELKEMEHYNCKFIHVCPIYIYWLT